MNGGPRSKNQASLQIIDSQHLSDCGSPADASRHQLPTVDLKSVLGIDYTELKDESILELHEKRDISGVILKGRYEIGDKLGEGCFGQVYTVKDFSHRDRSLIIKLQQKVRQFDREVRFMALYKKQADEDEEAGKRTGPHLFPVLHEHGVFIQLKTKTLGRFSEFEPEERQEFKSMEGLFLVPKKRHKYPESEMKSYSEEVAADLGPDCFVVQRRQIKHFYLIMDRLGDSLRKLHDKSGNEFGYQTVAQIGVQLITSLEQIHRLGYCYNDIKPDNILVGKLPLRTLRKKSKITKEDLEEYSRLHFIDFGLVSRFESEDGAHIEPGIPDKFKGSMLFASKFVFNFTMTSRRDDLISLCYLLVFLADEAKLGIISEVEGMPKKDKFRFIKQHKLQQSALNLCGGEKDSPETFRLQPFVEEVFALEFDEVPNYSKLKFLLTKSLLDAGIAPNKKHYDWLTKEQKMVQTSPTGLKRAQSLQLSNITEGEEESKEVQLKELKREPKRVTPLKGDPKGSRLLNRRIGKPQQRTEKKQSDDEESNNSLIVDNLDEHRMESNHKAKLTLRKPKEAEDASNDRSNEIVPDRFESHPGFNPDGFPNFQSAQMNNYKPRITQGMSQPPPRSPQGHHPQAYLGYPMSPGEQSLPPMSMMSSQHAPGASLQQKLHDHQLNIKSNHQFLNNNKGAPDEDQQQYPPQQYYQPYPPPQYQQMPYQGPPPMQPYPPQMCPQQMPPMGPPPQMAHVMYPPPPMMNPPGNYPQPHPQGQFYYPPPPQQQQPPYYN